MKFSEFARHLEIIEAITLRNRITEELAGFFSLVTADEAKMASYLLQGRVAPLYEPIEFGIADKIMITAISRGLAVDPGEVTAKFKSLGDLGSACESLKQAMSQKEEDNLTISEVFGIFQKVAFSSGFGSQDGKISLLADLVARVNARSARYIVRIPLGKLRLGFSDMTVLDSLSWMVSKSKEKRKEIERAFNVKPDLGLMAQIVKEQGVEGLKQIRPEIGAPVRMARADRLNSAKEILEKIGECAVEFKYDGLRLQVHYSRNKGKEKIRFYSRNLENMTDMFPEIAASLRDKIKAGEVILEGEVVAYNPQNGVSIPFQKTMQRRRKYDIALKAEEIPVKLYCFELLFLDGKNYINLPYKERKAKLREILANDEVIKYAEETVVIRDDEIEKLFDRSVKEGYEGIIAKRLEGNYQAGMRGFNWIKYKKAMRKSLTDTFDVVVMGYTKGQGKRTGFGVGQFLTGIYNKDEDRIETLTNIGTGLTDEQFAQIMSKMKDLKLSHKPANYDADKLLESDVWIKPEIVVEISADEITQSRVHTAGRVMQVSRSGSAWEVKKPGFSLRFPRLVSFRDDKNLSEITTLEEIRLMYEKQKKD